MIVATRESGEGEGESSERESGVWRENFPKRRPSMFDGEEDKRLMREERVGPEIVIFCNGRSSMAEEESEIGEGREERESEVRLRLGGGGMGAIFSICFGIVNRCGGVIP